MKFSEAWLREWVNPPIGREALFEQLTMAGLEIEGFEPVADAFTGVVVGEVVSVSAHPDADKLSVCEVNDGANRLQVVCGAPNVHAGMKSAFARVGAVLPGNFKIKQAKLRGVASQGMLCSAAELGVGDDHDGIVELDAGLAPGREVREALSLDDVTAELNLTPNRGDCLSIRGLAREVGVLNDMPVDVPAVVAAPVTSDETLPVSLEAPAGCPRFLGRVIRGVDIAAPTPLWMKEKLRRSGLRSVDAVVDVTNYVMLELGQPMHAYDLNRLRDGIVVRMARSGEALELLDGHTVTLDTDTLLITDADGPVGMAGVMGGERSGTQPDTRDVFLECAFFAPLAVAGTARRYGLHTDASHRYERGVDFELQHRAVERATGLLLEIVGGSAGPVTEAVAPEHLPARRQVRLRERRLQQLMGVAIDTAEVDGALTRLDFELVDRSSSTEEGVCWTIEAPTHRFDIEREADLVEEVCRIYGYNRVPARRPATELELRQVPRDASPELDLKKLLADLGFQEAVTYSFVDSKLQDLLDPGAAPLALANPMSSEQSVMRTNLLPGLVETLRVNLTRQQERVRLFESGLCFLPGDPVRQVHRVGGVCCGPRAPANWAQPAEAVDFFDVKGLVERLFEWTGLGERVSYRPADDPVLHPGQGAEICLEDAVVGRLGRLHPEVEAALDVTKAVYLFEIEGETMLARALRRHSGISRFPSVRRDLALVVAREVPAARVEAVVRESLGEVLVDFTLFDVYQGKGIDSNEKSLAVGLTLQDASATLTEDRIARYTQDVLAALERAVGARLRSGGAGP
jgi:phenylalanyl-tRNA synthetase beta chain